jgi:hypothetical protein
MKTLEDKLRELSMDELNNITVQTITADFIIITQCQLLQFAILLQLFFLTVVIKKIVVCLI